MILRDASALVIAGIVCGGLAAWYLARLVEAMLFQVKTTNTAVFVSAAATLAGVGVAAALVPARRAAKIDPIEALRVE